MKRAILMCAGAGKRWNNYLGIRKHLLQIGKERLIDRTVRLLRERTDAEICIAAFDDGYDVAGARRFEPPHGRDNYTDTDKFLCSVDYWSADDQTILVYGDVFFTSAAMNAITSFNGHYSFFGRPGPSECTGRPWAEMFALSFAPAARETVRSAILAVRDLLVAGKIKRGGGWEVYRFLKHMVPICLLERAQPVADSFVTIDDSTDDFDHPADFEEWKRRYLAYVERNRARWQSKST
jgi:hypothetical protein